MFLACTSLTEKPPPPSLPLCLTPRRSVVLTEGQNGGNSGIIFVYITCLRVCSQMQKIGCSSVPPHFAYLLFVF